ncbi:probable serine/threonine-protein kinase mkcB [Oppia nitens]|uniref:probable serine/threonine-protein kinase mkcB n=1 Tax=Oppia nitens TaxID=1686743 RepID=UPI0023DA4D3B|nr:probable serine/threonine-protein kinase mkcB [Oppia nitens]
MPRDKEAIGKIGGGMFILILVILFFAAHGGSNEMMYITLTFVFIIIALFSYGFWSSVSKGEGIWQYVGKHNLQHQQISNPNYHFGSFRTNNYKENPNKNVHLCAPPKMGGARLNIYTIPLNNSQSSLSRSPSVRSPVDNQHHQRTQSVRRSPSNQQQQQHHHHHHRQIGRTQSSIHHSMHSHHNHHRSSSFRRSPKPNEPINGGRGNGGEVNVEIHDSAAHNATVTTASSSSTTTTTTTTGASNTGGNPTVALKDRPNEVKLTVPEP